MPLFMPDLLSDFSDFLLCCLLHIGVLGFSLFLSSVPQLLPLVFGDSAFTYKYLGLFWLLEELTPFS